MFLALGSTGKFRKKVQSMVERSASACFWFWRGHKFGELHTLTQEVHILRDENITLHVSGTLIKSYFVLS
jgi:hypothetical protein